MKDCSLKICCNCGECNKISITRKGWWFPVSYEIKEPCFSINNGSEYGPTDNCQLKFEHLVLDKRIGFKLNTFEDFNDLYKYLRENEISFKNPFGAGFYINKNNKFYEEENYLNFKKLIKNTQFYQEGVDKILFDDKGFNFVKETERISDNKINWLVKFAKKRICPDEFENKKEAKHKIVFPVAGVSFEDRQEKIKRLSTVFNSGKRMEVEFIPEPENQYDKNAIKICVLNNGVSEFVGYVPKTLNKDQDNENKIEDFNSMIFSILDNIESAETSWIGEKNGNYGMRIVCYEKTELN